MAELDAVLAPSSANVLRDALLTLTKFSEEVFLEARPDYLAVSSLDTSRIAFISFRFAATIHPQDPSDTAPEPTHPEENATEQSTFFDRYHFQDASTVSQHDDARDRPVFCGSFLIKALLWAFKGRPGEGASEASKETAVQYYELSLLENTEGACRLVIRMPCRNGVTTVYRLVYEDVQSIQPIDNRSDAPNLWEISSKILWDHVDHFVRRGEHLDIGFEDGNIHLKCYTEKVVDGKDIIKKPSKTKLRIGSSDFDTLTVSQTELPIRIPIKDFVAMAMHANGFDTKIRAYWSQPKKPILFTYQWEGMQCEYTVMTAKPIFDPEEDGPVPVAGVPTSKGSTPAIIFNRAPPERSKHGKSDLAMRTKELQAHKTVKSQHPRLAALGPHASEAPEVPSSGLFLHDSTAPDPAVDQQLDDTDGPLETVRWDASAQFQSSAHLQARDHQSRPEKHTENAARAVNSSTVIPKKRSRRLADSEDEWDDFGTGADNEDDSAYGARADDTQPLAYGGKLGASRADGQEAETDTAGFVVQGRTLEATQRLSQIKSIFDDFPDFE